MKHANKFDIEIIRLSDGVHQYEYELEDSFFSLIEESFIKKGSLRATVELNKSERLMEALFKISGTVELTCDRSLEIFDYKINSEEKLIFKYGETFEEISEDVVMIPRDLQRLSLVQYLYDFIGLAIPMKKLHPKFENSEDSTDNDVLIYQSDKKENNTDEAPSNDPRWNALKDLKNKFK
jgi:uncharacterized protein